MAVTNLFLQFLYSAVCSSFVRFLGCLHVPLAGGKSQSPRMMPLSFVSHKSPPQLGNTLSEKKKTCWYNCKIHGEYYSSLR